LNTELEFVLPTLMATSSQIRQTDHHRAPRVQPPAHQARQPQPQTYRSPRGALATAARRSPDPTARTPKRGRSCHTAPYHHRRAEQCGQTKPKQLLDSTTNQTRPTTAARPPLPPAALPPPPRKQCGPDKAKAALPPTTRTLARSQTHNSNLAAMPPQTSSNNVLSRRRAAGFG
jgi:hypothetical protein